jgi:hypothetical protein
MPAPSSYGAPGVYVEWLDANAQQLDVGRTDIAGFIGIAERGPLHSARKIESVRQFVSTFGAHIPQSYLAYAVEGFFANGGRTCWVVRVADPRTAKRARIRLSAGGAPFVLAANNAGVWGNDIQIESVWSRDGIDSLIASEPDRTQAITGDLGRVTQIISIAASGQPRRPTAEATVGLRETDLPELATAPLVELAPDDGSLPLVTLSAGTPTARLAGGTDGVASLQPMHFAGDPDRKSSDLPLGMDALAKIDGVSFVAAPDLLFQMDRSALEVEFAGFDAATSRDAQLAMLSSCIARGDRMLLVDLPPVGKRAALESVSNKPRTVAALPRDSYAAVYYPWIIVNDPLRTAGTIRAIPPSGHVAGMFARTDRLRGVHKSPANEVLEGVWDVTEQIDDAAHAGLNTASINAIRAIPGRDVRVLGARTLSDDPRWRYVNVRRLFAMIEEALDEQMQWLVFEPNTPRLWREIDRAVRGFLERMFRAGMLDGATSEEAYFVRCDATTNPSFSTDDGRAICELGLQPPYPAEFVIVRIGVTRSGIEIEEKGAQDV